MSFSYTGEGEGKGTTELQNVIPISRTASDPSESSALSLPAAGFGLVVDAEVSAVDGPPALVGQSTGDPLVPKSQQHL